MKRRALAAPLCFFVALQPLSAAAAACGDQDFASFKTAALQQELMVAALSCHQTDAYNSFVVNHRRELIASDGDLRNYFMARDAHGGDAAYNAFKTDLATEASLRSSEGPNRFCADTDAEFNFVLQPASLSRIVDEDQLVVEPASLDCKPPSRWAMRIQENRGDDTGSLGDPVVQLPAAVPSDTENDWQQVSAPHPAPDF